MAFLYSIIVGILAGYIASRIRGNENKGCLINLIIGALGGLVGGWLFSLLGITTTGCLGEIITAVVGSVVVLWLFSLLSGKK